MAVFNAIVKKDYNHARELLGRKGDSESMLFSDENIKTLFTNNEYSLSPLIIIEHRRHLH